jgi:hypothetical protein
MISRYLSVCIIGVLLSSTFAFINIVSDGTTLFALNENTLWKYRLTDLSPLCSISLSESNQGYNFVVDSQGRYLFSFENSNSGPEAFLFRIDTATGQKTILFNQANQAVRQVVAADSNYVFFIYTANVTGDNGPTSPNYYLRRSSITTGSSSDVHLPSAITLSTYSPANNAIFVQTASLGCSDQPPYGCSERVAKIDLVSFTLGSSYDIAGESAQFVSPKDELISIGTSLSYYSIADNQPVQLTHTVDVPTSSYSPSLLVDIQKPNSVNVGFRTNFVTYRGYAAADEYLLTQYDTQGNQLSSVLIPNSNLTNLDHGGFGFGISNGILYFYQQSEENQLAVIVGVSIYTNGQTITKDLTMSTCSGATSAPSTLAPSTATPGTSKAPATTGSPSTTQAPATSAAPGTTVSPATTQVPSSSASGTQAPSSQSPATTRAATTTSAPGSQSSGDNNARQNSSTKVAGASLVILVLAAALL